MLFIIPISHRPGRKKDFTPLCWSQYFETMEDVEVENDNGKDISFMLTYIHALQYMTALQFWNVNRCVNVNPIMNVNFLFINSTYCYVIRSIVAVYIKISFSEIIMHFI